MTSVLSKVAGDSPETADTAENQPRFIMVGGFLGAGKTTFLLRLAAFLQGRGLRGGLITNDQAAGLVDTALLEELNLPVREIAGGCFCCRSETLVQALDRLTADNHPEVFLAEPVGSCTDLVATVTLPLERIYKKGFTMAPYLVIVDPFRAMQSFGVGMEPIFSEDVTYIYRKQLEEAEIIVINKVDLLDQERVRQLRERLGIEYPEARIFECATRPGTGLEEIFELVTGTAGSTRGVMGVDYDRYATGEALLGWLNLQATLSARPSSGGEEEPADDVNDWLMELSRRIAGALSGRGIEIAHMKMSVANSDADHQSPDGALRGGGGKGGGGHLAAVQWVRNGAPPETSRRMSGALLNGRLLINVRAEADPDALSALVFGELAAHLEARPEWIMSSLQTKHFSPGRPVPTHRVGEV